MVDHLKAMFPGLATTLFRVTSPPDRIYNCIAWAAGDTTDWWWPLESWPTGVARDQTLAAFTAAFATLGYQLCSGEELEDGSEKLALFADSAGLPTHAARQLPNGRWTSKLGESEDIEHELRALEGDIYGTVVLVLKRALPPAPSTDGA
jgi:hypothetical protein